MQSIQWSGAASPTRMTELRWFLRAPSKSFVWQWRQFRRKLQAPVYPAGMSEQDKRASHLDGINDVLNGTPLAAFSSRHLALLELMLAYWRELEVEGEVRAHAPDAVN
jgi:hypothetical protein